MTVMPGSKPATPAPAAAQPLVLARVEGGVGVLTLNHPEKRNALSRAMISAISDGLAQFRADKKVKAIIIAANGPVYSAGHDLKEFVGASAEQTTAILDACTTMMESLRLLPKAVIAQVSGLASAAGCQLAASCDLVVAASTAQFQTPGVKIGLFCSTPMIPLSRTISPKKALEMLLTGQPISAEAAEKAGLVTRIVPPESLAQETLTLAQQIAAYSGDTIGLGKIAFYSQLPLELPKAYAVGKDAMQRNAKMADAQEGMSAFLQKRTPKWTS
jgi:enoyl-CoA hydratase/carnithine racemase